MPNQNISQIDLFNAIIKHLNRNEKIKKTPLPRELNKIIECCNMIVSEFKKSEKKYFPGMGLDSWLKSDDTGMSSMFMASVLGNMQTYKPYYYPLDSSDFGRCYGLLEAVPEFKDKLALMKATGKEWSALVDNWSDLTKLYLYANYKELDDMIYSLTQ